ncbi:hypothetical protein V8B55DRAFT_1498904 [Mucor lusitanicus]|uniref:Uncharacterized protein n=2 Tax=Mucor circinelloides f. lusitanicus TaxID=29924 RepID=A0A162MU52_MUCCL|nr:hypothetical protein FB192DRAFT_1358480 [Mucor lusitanicus]OAD05465.1 hypothetical protein MUCCIDRAFT_155897 [Mucor lusitanicus CBS 277.49]
MVPPIHIIKKDDDSFALVHFATEVYASTFYHVYAVQDKVLCPRLGNVKVNPSLMNNQSVVYNAFQVQPRISSSKRILCSCPPDNTGNTTSNYSTG